MRSFCVVALVLLATACQPSPADCIDKGDIQACRSLCDTGKEEFLPLCYEERARQVEACVDKDEDCAAACELWKGTTPEDVAGQTYRAKLGSEDKVAKLTQKCGS